MIEKDYQFKRLLLRDELEEVHNLIADAPEFVDHYPNHKKWLRSSLEEIYEGTRLAFGILKSVTVNQQPQLKLIGVIIIKITEPVAELKSLFLHEEYRQRQEKYAMILYQNTEQHVVKRGITKIITDVPCQSKHTTLFLIKNGFQINGVIGRYKKGDKNYLLSKELIPYYTGDPYDWDRIVAWFLENKYNSELVERQKINNATTKHRFNLNINGVAAIPNHQSIKGMALVFDGILDLKLLNEAKDHLQNNDEPICIVIARKIETDTETQLQKQRILCINEDAVYEQCGCDRPPFSIEEIKGVLAEIRYTYFESIQTDKEEFAYFKGTGVGQFAKAGDTIYFFVDSSEEFPNGAIMGYGKIKEATINAPDKQWSHYEHLNPIFTKESYFRFASYKNSILAYVVTDFQKIKPIDYHRARSILRSVITSDEIGHFYLNDQLVSDLSGYLASQQNDKSTSGVENDFKAIVSRLDSIATTQDKIKEITLRMHDDLLIIDSPSISSSLKIKITTPGAGILPVSMEKEINIDLGKIDYEQLETELAGKFGSFSKRIMKKLEEKNWIKKKIKSAK